MQLTRLFLGFIGALGLVLAVSDTARATSILPGFDLWSTIPGSAPIGTTVDLGPLGIVPLQGNPLPGLGDADTIVERKAGLGPPFDPPADTDVIPIEIVALQLRSISPVDISGTLFDLDIISGSLLGEPTNPIGQMTVTHDFANGGTFTVDLLPVDAKATFTEVGNPLNTFDQFIPVEFVGAVGGWSHTPGPMDLHGPLHPSGDFFAGIDHATGEKLPPVVHPAGPGFPPGHLHVVRAAMVPEPSTSLLLGLALAGLAVMRRRRTGP